MFHSARSTRFFSLAAAILATLSYTPGDAAEPSPYAPQPQAVLKRMLTIEWHKGSNLPHGFQDSDGGIIHDTLISVGGFCSGQKGVRGKEDKYPRGFFDKVWCLSLQDAKAVWQAGPKFPGAPRQELFAIDVDGALYCWGGFSYEKKDNAYFSDVFVYDTETGDFGTATPLPLNNNLAMAVLRGDTLHLVGGETGGCEIDGEAFGHHPDLYLIGTIKK